MYAVVIPNHVAQQLRHLPPSVYPVVRAAIQALAANPRPIGCIKMTGRADWRIRVGNYRVVYMLDDPAQTVTLLDVGHRRDVYR